MAGTRFAGFLAAEPVVMWRPVFEELNVTIASREQLIALGASGALLTSAVREHLLIRVRRDHYALPTTPRPVLHAVRIGGRLACTSALRDYGVFGFDHLLHVHMRKEASRSRSPVRRDIPLTPHNRLGAHLHWQPLGYPGEGNEYRVGLVDALSQAVRCNERWHAIASLDNAIHQGKLSERELARVFQLVPERYKDLRADIDGRSEAGQETVLRCAFRAVGMEPELQVEIPGVGRVDLVVEGRMIIEADSRQAHDGWELHVRDRDRDIDAARLGYMSLRPAFNRTMYATSDVVEAVLHLLAATRRFRTIL